MASNQVTITVVANVEDGEVQNLDQLIEDLKSKAVGVDVEVEDGEVQAAGAEIDDLNQTAEVDIEVDDTAVQTSMANIQSGLNDVKAGFGEVAQGMGEVLSSAGRMEQTETFLSMNLGADEAKKKLQEIRSVTDELPGDDVALQNLLSQSALKDTKLGVQEFKNLGGAAADYMAAMQNFGKSSTETQQDLMNYILQGNTAEIERSPVLQAHIDKLKEGADIQERSKLLAEALNEEGWSGISQQDTYNNKLQTFSDLIERGKMNFGGLFLDATKGAMGFIGDIDQATGGVLGMGVALASEFGPGLFQGTQGLISMGSGLSTMAKQYGGIIPMIGSFGSTISGAGSSLLALATGPVGIAIAAIIALAVAIYEIGKAFGWWSDLGTMFEAISAGATAMWNAFMSNEYVIQIIDLIKQGLTDAWNAIVGFGQAIMSALTGAGGEFDILSWAINGLQTVLNAVGPVVVMIIQLMIERFRQIYQAAVIIWPYIAAAVSGAIGVIRGVISGAMAIWSGLQSAWRTLQSVASSVFGAINGIVSGAGGVWNSFKSTVQGAIDGIMSKINDLKSAAEGVANLIPGLGGGGIETPIVSSPTYGAGGTTSVSSGNTIIFNMYGDVRDEKTIDDMIDAINSRVQFDALSNGITSNEGGAI